MKRLCERHFPGVCPNFNPEYILGENAPTIYFQSLDAFVEASLTTQDKYLNYLYVTWLIEERALEVYSTYQNVLEQSHFAFGVKSLLAEEKVHLQETVKSLAEIDSDFSSRSAHFQSHERDLFRQFLQSMVNA